MKRAAREKNKENRGRRLRMKKGFGLERKQRKAEERLRGSERKTKGAADGLNTNRKKQATIGEA